MTEGLYLAWNQPAYFGGDVYVYYELSVNGDDLEDKFVVSSQLNTTSFKVDESQLVIGETYQFTAISWNSWTHSIDSNILELKYLRQPGAPTGLQEESTDDRTPDSITVSWTEPEDKGDADLVQY